MTLLKYLDTFILFYLRIKKSVNYIFQILWKRFSVKKKILKTHHARVSVRRTSIGVNGWRWIEDDTIHYSITGKSNKLLLFAIIDMLVHIHVHVMTRHVHMNMGMIWIGSGFVCRSGPCVMTPNKNCLPRVLPATPSTFKITATAKGNFIYL